MDLDKDSNYKNDAVKPATVIEPTKKPPTIDESEAAVVPKRIKAKGILESFNLANKWERIGAGIVIAFYLFCMSQVYAFAKTDLPKALFYIVAIVTTGQILVDLGNFESIKKGRYNATLRLIALIVGAFAVKVLG
jgi:hypothetical protein